MLKLFRNNKIKKRRNYTISFQKCAKYEGIHSYTIVHDTYIMGILYKLQEIYDFEIENIELKGNSTVFKSSITILCNEEDKNEIFKEFIQQLSGKICEIQF